MNQNGEPWRSKGPKSSYILTDFIGLSDADSSADILTLQNTIESGIWSAWSTPTECSRTCGGGVATQTRECLQRG